MPDEVEHLLRNAELRDELEPYFDESIRSVNVDELPTPVENEFLASMLAWERAPILPISQWFEPELKLPHPDALDATTSCTIVLWETIHKLFERRIVLDFTDHLSDRELYCLIYRDILPCSEKKIDSLDELSALGLRRRRRRPDDVAALLRHGRRARCLGRGFRRTAARGRRASVSAPVAAPAAVASRPMRSLSHACCAARSCLERPSLVLRDRRVAALT